MLEATGKVQVEEMDFTEPEAVEKLFSKYQFKQVVHLAAYAGVTPSVKQPVLYEQVNVTGTLLLLEACRKQGIKNFTMASSSSVYGGNTKTPFSESDPVEQPICPYAATKRSVELHAYTYCHLFGMNIPCLRFFTVYGPRQRPEMAIVKFIRHIEQGRPILLYNEGKYHRDYTYIDDIIDGVVAAMDRRSGHELFNLGGSRTTSTIDLVKMIESKLDKKANVELKPGRPGEVETTFADVSKSGEVLGYSPKVPLEEGISRTVEWFQSLDFVWE